MAIAVVVNKGTACAPASRTRLEEAGLFRHVRKRAVAVIAIETILSEVGAEDVVKAIVVVISDADSIGPSSGFQTGLFSHIGERSIAVVLIKAVGRFRRISFDPSAGQNKDVHPTVIVIIDKSAAATVGFEDVFLGFDSAVDDGPMQPGLFGHVGKVRVERFPRWRRLGLRLQLTRGDSLTLGEKLL